MYTEAAFHRVLIEDRAPATERSRPSALLEAVILCNSPMVAQALGRVLASPEASGRGPLVLPQDPMGSAHPTDAELALLVPQCWQELATWLPGLSERLPCPWLLVAEPRVAGMFLSRLEERQSLFLSTDVAVPLLWRAIHARVHGPCPSLRHDLLGRFVRGATLHVPSWTGRFPTAAELQCGCAVSFGLGNREIAQALFVSEATVKSHVHQLLEKFALSNRRELGALFSQAFASRPSVG